MAFAEFVFYYAVGNYILTNTNLSKNIQVRIDKLQHQIIENQTSLENFDVKTQEIL